ncbi:P-II family nitrogen regulator [Fangia hongkongensis]|uniref:P-II family nitrogen regulator n=1 Tax=Fangia hongkongensis TaxID=270495 RepID=UPI0003826055|nr:P-II family nitrogen regulator [Fangia hongkongensis]MBK2125277.1 P-II family nitrogen regulator [Fangia hongkongensis]
MKLVSAYIKPFLLDETREALINVGIHGMTVYEIKGIGKQLGHTELYRGAEYAVDFLPKVKLEVICTDAQKSLVVETILEANRSEKIGAGKITVITLDEVIRIRTGEKDENSV